MRERRCPTAYPQCASNGAIELAVAVSLPMATRASSQVRTKTLDQIELSREREKSERSYKVANERVSIIRRGTRTTSSDALQILQYIHFHLAPNRGRVTLLYNNRSGHDQSNNQSHFLKGRLVGVRID